MKDEIKNDKKVCNNKMNYNECELAILRMQVDKAQEKMSRRVVNSPEIKEMFHIVEQFIKKKKSSLLWRNKYKCIIT